VRETRTLRVMWRELETGHRSDLGPTAPVPDPTREHRDTPFACGQRRPSLQRIHIDDMRRAAGGCGD
jgi:hypothetical protein